MPTARIGDIDVLYEIEGEGPPLLAIMGLTGTLGHWRGFPQRFSDRYRVITFDNRGAGGTSAPPGPYTTAQLARDALGLLDHLAIQSAVVLGVSMGGMIAQALALEAPERVTRLVLACTSLGGRNAIPPDAEVLAAFSSGSGGSGGAQVAVRRLLALNFSPRFLEERAPVFEELVTYGLANRMTRTGFYGQVAAVGMHDVAARAHEIRIPTLVITGTLDRLIPAGNAALLGNAIAGSRVVTLEGAGHMFWIEAADEAEKAIRAFLESA
jgi:pimeloyl-ACP methyl ester carboxylesterase